LIKMTGGPPTTLSRNQRYLLHAYETSGRGRGLDYGCGDGHLVAGAAERGHDFWGTEPYYGEDGFRSESQSRTPEAARERVRLLDSDNRIPWDDDTFEWVCSGQVIEHVHDLDTAVDELARVTRTGGLGLHTFPTVESVREQHNGVPYFHRVPRRMRRRWAAAWYKAGVAYRFDYPDFEAWSEAAEEFFDQSVVLRKRRTIVSTFERYFDVRDVGTEKLTYHLPFRVPNVAPARWLEARRHGVTLMVTRR
jgi:SAM-dependent methyltransferase